MSLTSAPQAKVTFHSSGASPSVRGEVDQAQPTIFERWPAYIAITLAGIGGFVGLLAASAYFPQFARPLRIAALIWFAWFGVIRLATARKP